MAVSERLRADLIASIPNLRAFATSLIGAPDRADDLVQETLVKAWRHIDSFQEGTNLKAWLFTILRNEFYTQMRRGSREVGDVNGAYAARLATHPEQHGHLDLDDFRKAFTKLPAEQREALILVGASGFAYEEAAEICGVAVGTIKSRVSRGRVQLADMLSIHEPDTIGPDAIAASVLTARRS
jgi:RNA polymerase sigma-70 factor (ECF subfamily)